jgi:cobalt-zinc-cadmium efflux system membrane fusion protein
MTRALIVALVLAAAGCQRTATETAGAQTTATRTEVVLSAAAQAEGQIETKPAMVTSESETYRVSGRIALADNRNWRVGIRTDGLVVALNAGVGDYVRKGDVLARYHADEVRDSRAKYHAAQADLGRARSAAALAQRNLERAGTLLGCGCGRDRRTQRADGSRSSERSAGGRSSRARGSEAGR